MALAMPGCCNDLSLSPGDIVLVDFGPAIGRSHIQKGRRPAVVLGQPKILADSNTPILQVVPLTTKKKFLPVHTKIYDFERFGLSATSFAIAEQMQTIDRESVIKKLGHIDDKELLNKIKSCVLQQLGY